MTVPPSPPTVGDAPDDSAPDALDSANRHTVTPRQWVPAGARVSAVAHKLGLPTGDVLRALQRLGWNVYSGAESFPRWLDAARVAEAVASLPPRPPRGTPAPWTPPPPDPVTATEAAQRLGVTPATIRQWVARGYLVPVGKRGSANVFNPDDVRGVRDQAAARRPRTTGDALGSLGYAEPGELRHHEMDELVTGPRAAELVGVSPSTIRNWVARGHLKPHTPGTRPLFRLRDVLSVRRRATRPPARFRLRLDPQ